MEDKEMNIALSAEDLVKSFGALRAVDGLSLSIAKGEVFGFLGPNGAGKTTSIKLLCGLLKPDSGRIDLHSQNSHRSIGLCPQNIVVWENLKCLEQLVFMGEMYGISSRSARIRALELLDQLGLMQKKDSLAKTLSGGMQRRLNIALALIHDPAILILDEPQAGLDPQSRVLVRDHINFIKSRTTVILTTHDMEEAEKMSDRVCIIDHGKVLATGTVDEIRRSLGKGDLFEIEIEGDVEKEIVPYVKSPISGVRCGEKGILSFVAENSQATVLEVMGIVKGRALKLRNFRMRETSLEDVFINLTGRRLRE